MVFAAVINIGRRSYGDKWGHFFLFICGEYEDGVMQATGGNLVSMSQYCASVYNCTDPQNCWMEDIKAHNYNQNLDGVKAVSLMPGCRITGESIFLGVHS